MFRRFVPALTMAAMVLFAFQISISGTAKTLVVVTNTPVAEASTVRTCTVTASLYQVYAGASVDISWQTQGFDVLTLNGQTVSGPNGSKTFNNIQENTTYTLVAQTADGKSNCTNSVTVLCLPTPPPACTLNPTAKTIASGESVDLTWTTTNAASASLTSFGTVALNGTKNTGPLTSGKTYTLDVVGFDGTNISCQSVITVQDTPKVCELSLTKSVSASTAKPGDELTYTITIKNTGTGDCSGSGVKIVDVHDAQLTFISATQSSNILPGYTGTPLYTPATRTLIWNGDVFTPGETGTITWKAKVNSLTCETTKVIKNTAKATALELDNFSTWINSNTVQTTATGASCPVPPPTCSMSPASTTVESGQSVTLTWQTTNASSTTLTDFGTVALNGTQNTGALTASKTYILTVVGKDGSTISCQSIINVKNVPPAPSCDAFTANPTTILKGASSTLAWQTTNATRVVIDNGVGEVSVDGSLSVSPLATTLYTLKAYTEAGAEVSCKATVTVEEPPLAPKCVSFGANPATLPAGGGNTVLTWSTLNGTSVTISPIGSVALSGSTTVNVSTTTTYSLTVAGQGGQSDSCVTTVVVTPPEPVPFTCENNVSFGASPTSITRGDASTLTWNTTNVTAVRFNQGIAATGLSGSLTVEPTDTTTYILTATQDAKEISCPVTVTVTTGGGGGGGSASPTCELSVSDNSIRSGDTVTLRWDTNRATEVELVDGKNKVLVTTKDKLSDDKKDYYDGSLRVSPTSDTIYTLTAERGSRDRVCTVKVKVSGDVVVTQIRDQQPLVSGIALTQVPYTGFKAGPFMTFSFYALLMAWALYIAYILVVKRDVIGGYALASNHIVAEAPTPEEIRPDVFVASVRTPTPMPTAVSQVPVNLPTASAVVGYAKSTEVKHVESEVTNHAFSVTDEVVTALENYAHTKKALLSSDAIRHLVGVTTSLEEGIATLSEVITESKAKYPSEDGWVVINERRMHDLCEVCKAKPAPSSEAPFVPTVIPEGSGSLAEAIVTGNIVAAYEMIGHRPMFALADAAADMDSVLRARRGGKEVISTMLREVTATLSEEQIIKIIEALTGALDGTYTDEASAVKMAIMKAVKVIA
jgi:uncharacterized repeat protein (TIGR01451 family)